MLRILTNKNLRIMAIYYIGMGIATSMASPLIPSYVIDVGLSMSRLGLAASISALLTAIFLPTLGYIGDRYSRKAALLSAVTFRLLALSLFAFTSDPFTILVGYMINEFGFLIYLPIARSIISDAAGREAMGRAYGELITIISLIEVIFPTISGQLYNLIGDYNTMFKGIFLLALFSTPILFFLEDRGGRLEISFKHIFRFTSIEKRIYIPAVVESVSWRIWIFLLYLVPKEVLALGPDYLGFAYTVQSMVWFMSQYISGYLVDRIGAKKVYIISDSLGIPIALIYTLYLNPITFLVSTGLFGLSISLWIPAFTRMIYEASTESTRAVTYSKVDSLRYLFSTPMSYVGGYLYDNIHHALPFIVGILLIGTDLLLEYEMFPDV